MDRTLILKMIFVLGFLMTLVLSFFYSIMLIVPLLIGILVFSCFFTLKQLAELTWFMLAIASFFWIDSFDSGFRKLVSLSTITTCSNHAISTHMG
ncbi:hypothetical protein PCORN_16958 [Listeria cornellensis FSL F6-0969]|uniref:Uncharacterized protein n=1 Tax=Listeria cornellensis FSL F6-0969 TaxID=1265820 RepID=W7BL24_9LIST|nr:hypothetical protein PCORN_16958 [Listeria cornellensis FSL F6-0969]